MKQIFKKDDIAEDYPSISDSVNIQYGIYEADLVDRAFTGLEREEIIDNKNRSSYSIKYQFTNNCIIAESTFAILEDVCYFSWIKIYKPLRGQGYGDELLNQTINQIKKRDAKEIYLIPKSKEAKGLFKKHGFEKYKNDSQFMYKNI
jgi:N-acetylglutamate synthase-like GNAT family acetyltransferase